MQRFISTVLSPCVAKVKEENQLLDSQKALLILDVFAAHRTDAVLNQLKSAGVVLLFIPANCTGELQPLDLSVNICTRQHCRTSSRTGMLNLWQSPSRSMVKTLMQLWLVCKPRNVAVSTEAKTCALAA